MREEKKEFFKCGICGEEYLTALARNACETACLKKAEEKAKVLKNAEKEKKRREIDSKIDELKQLITDYNNVFNGNLKPYVDVYSDGSNYYATHINESIDAKTLAEMINKAFDRARLFR